MAVMVFTLPMLEELVYQVVLPIIILAMGLHLDTGSWNVFVGD